MMTKVMATLAMMTKEMATLTKMLVMVDGNCQGVDFQNVGHQVVAVMVHLTLKFRNFVTTSLIFLSSLLR